MATISVASTGPEPVTPVEVWLRGLSWGTFYGTISGAIVGTGVFPGVGTFCGLIAGFLIGLVFSQICGFVVGAALNNSPSVRMHPKAMALIGASIPTAMTALGLIAWALLSRELQALPMILGLAAPVIFTGAAVAVMSACANEVGRSLPGPATITSYVVLVAFASAVLVFVGAYLL